MSEYKIKLTGWNAVILLFVLIGAFGVRLMTFNDKMNDKALMREIELQLVSDYFPKDVDKLKAVYATGDVQKMESTVTSITSTRLNIESVRVCYPLFDFSTPKDVVVKVIYSLNDASGTREKGEKYYLFQHSSLGNSWRYKHKTNIINYYLNFF